jgi:hypothetical protein
MRIAMSVLLLVGAAAGAVTADDPELQSLSYDVVALKGKLLVEIEPKPTRLSLGDRAVSGDILRTGSSSWAELEVAARAARFRLGGSTRCTLTHDRPGVLLHVDKGRLRAVFGTADSDQPRLVTTPSAVLDVRGTEYGLRVEKDGDTDLVVFSGVVEVTDPAGMAPPILVEAGQQTRIRLDHAPDPPTRHRIAPDDWDRGRTAWPPEMGRDGSSMGSRGEGFDAPGAGPQGGGGGSKRPGG